MSQTLSRRQAMFAAVALPLAPALLPMAAQAAVPLQGPRMPLFHRAKLGAFEVTTLLAGSREGDKPQETFGLNVPAGDFAAVFVEDGVDDLGPGGDFGLACLVFVAAGDAFP